MHTSLLLIALMSPSQSAEGAVDGPKWQPTYAAAIQVSREQSKPVAVFVGSGTTGWQKVTTEALSPETRKMLADNYVCCYVDVAEPRNARLAQALEMESGPGLVLSTREGTSQAYWHNGAMSNRDLEGSLNRYAMGAMVANTETINRTRISYAYDPAQGTNTATRRIAGPLQSVTTIPSMAVPYPTPTYSHAPTYSGQAAPAGYHYSAQPMRYGSFGGGCSGGRCGR